jgi:hypothetical protein
MGTEGYCVACKGKIVMVNPIEIKMRNGKPATQGFCPTCGGKVFKIGASRSILSEFLGQEIHTID